MLAPLDTPFADTRADALRFALGLPPLDALAVLAVPCGTRTVELRLLGASHQIICGDVSETVACLPDTGAPLPGRYDTASYAFTARTERHADDAAFARAVAAVRADLDGRRDALTGAFPGSPHAVTALLAEPSGLGWRTWHAYPQTREIVMTRSRLAVTP
ncbi:hypothetical protein BTM25_36550 [Actinomadura rubteroloni]|uniref:DUF2617 family protein n=1 Tax=Actinomadura rubteroloni TaxID=1926885 RepID=A0A2P4UIY0_9ACTN|nr:DUF2617 family protein [Actinomadura rubteroloni]POM25014.1 hypothetical protein BTM25_36550 [Actinomadura rubteroloni]